MTYSELKIQFDLNSHVNVLKNANIFKKIDVGYLFVDSEDGQCYLFDKNGNLDNISKVKSIKNYAFFGCKSLTNIQISDSVESIGFEAFYSISLTSIQIPNSVKSIGEWAFGNCTSLISIKIPDSVKSIGYEAFSYCTALTRIEIPSFVESIGDGAFYNCTSLKSIIFKGKTIDEVKAMKYYPWGIEDESTIKAENVAMLS